MRTPAELLFRFRQELRNAVMLARPPRLKGTARPPVSVLPDPAPVVRMLKNTPYAARIEELGGQILAHRFPLLGITLDYGPKIAWRRDYISGLESGLEYFRLIPFLDPARAGNHKVVCEINRHQHMVLLAQAFLLTDRSEFIDEVHVQLENWLDENPFSYGINWTSALEVAFRALSWTWVFHWAGETFPASLRSRFLESLYQHGCHIGSNLSVYFSPNTHLQGEAVTLHLLARAFPDWPRAAIWEKTGHQIVVEHMETKVREDGGYHEQSLHYHIYAMDFFLLHKLVARSTSAAYDARLQRMAAMIDAVMGPNDSIPAIGDEDGGRLFHPYGDRSRFSLGTLATAAVIYNRPEWMRKEEHIHEVAVWWVGDRAFDIAPTPVPVRHSKLFPDTGLAIMNAGAISIVADVGPFGPDAGAHSHSDTLSFTASMGDQEILIDPGTHTYVNRPGRDQFRSSAAHNTVRLDGHDQGAMIHPFRWASKPGVQLNAWTTDAHHDFLDANCQYREFVHRRVFVFLRGQCCLFILDVVVAPAGSHVAEQYWHPGADVVSLGKGKYRIGSEARLVLLPEAEVEMSVEGEYGWRSRALEHREPAPVLKVSKRDVSPIIMPAVVDFAGNTDAALEPRIDHHAITLRYGGAVVRIPC